MHGSHILYDIYSVQQVLAKLAQKEISKLHYKLLLCNKAEAIISGVLHKIALCLQIYFILSNECQNRTLFY